MLTCGFFLNMAQDASNLRCVMLQNFVVEQNYVRDLASVSHALNLYQTLLAFLKDWSINFNSVTQAMLVPSPTSSIIGIRQQGSLILQPHRVMLQVSDRSTYIWHSERHVKRIDTRTINEHRRGQLEAEDRIMTF